MILLTWKALKTIIPASGVLRCAEDDKSVHVFLIDNGLSVYCKIHKSNTDDYNDYSENYSALTNNVAVPAQSVKLLLARGSSASDPVTGVAKVTIKIPGTFGENPDGSLRSDRTISGGWGYFANQADGDYCYAEVRDDDNLLGYGAGAVLDTFHDLNVPASNQGWFFPRQEVLELRPLVTDDPSKLPCGMYLHIFGQKGVVGVDTFFVNLHWGAKLR